MAPANDVKTQTCFNLQHFVHFQKAKNRPKNVSKRHFFPILGTSQNGGGGTFMLLDPLFERPQIPAEKRWKPQQAEGFLVFFGAQRRRVGGLGRASP